MVSGGGVEIEFGSVAPGATAEHGFTSEPKTSWFSAPRRGGEDVEGMIEGYVTSGQGGDMEVTFTQDGSFEVRDKRPS